MISQLNSWLSPKLGSSYSYWKLCYRASVDGWRSRTFHNRCDNKGPTVTIVRVGSYIFGGYNDDSWQGRFSNMVSMTPLLSFVQNNVLNLGWERKVCFTILLSFVTLHLLINCSLMTWYYYVILTGKKNRYYTTKRFYDPCFINFTPTHTKMRKRWQPLQTPCILDYGLSI